MSDLDKNINRKEEGTPYEKILVNPIEKDKKEKASDYPNLEKASESQTFAALLSHLKKILASLPIKGGNRNTALNQYQLKDKVRAFRDLLALLAKEDQSHNPTFTLQLSLLWHSLLKDCHPPAPGLKEASTSLSKLQFFTSQVQNYPPGADHTLGYYFNEYAGNEWIPFPFMELLQQLHEDSIAHPAASTLKGWIDLLNEILNATNA